MQLAVTITNRSLSNLGLSVIKLALRYLWWKGMQGVGAIHELPLLVTGITDKSSILLVSQVYLPLYVCKSIKLKHNLFLVKSSLLVPKCPARLPIAKRQIVNRCEALVLVPQKLSARTGGNFVWFFSFPNPCG